MATNVATRIPDDPALTGALAAYQVWSTTSKYHKTAIDKLTSWSLGLAIGGAILATAGAQLGQFITTGFLGESAKWLGFVGAGAVALATFLSQRAQADNRITIWTRSRGAAESLKSVIFLSRAGVPPFDGLVYLPS